MSSEFGSANPNPAEQLFIRQRRVSEVVSQKGPLSAEDTNIIVSYLFDNIETMADVSKGSRLEYPSSGSSITFGGVDDISAQLINKSWERIKDSESIQADGGNAKKILLIWASARHWEGAYNTIASQFVEPNLDAVAKILKANKVEEEFAKEITGEHWREYRIGVLGFLDQKDESEGLDIEDFDFEKSGSFLQAVVTDDSSNLEEMQLAYRLMFADGELHDSALAATQNLGDRFKTAIVNQDSEMAVKILDAGLLNIDYEDFPKKPELNSILSDINTFILESLEVLSSDKVGDESLREKATRFVNRFFDLLPAEKQEQYLKNIQNILNEKASEGFESLEDLDQVSKQASFLYREKRFEERKNQKEGNIGNLAEFIRENKPFIEAFFTTLNHFKQSAKSPEEMTRIQEIKDLGVVREFKFTILGNPELFIDEAPHYLSLLYPDGNVERNTLTTFIKEPQSWLKVISNRLSNTARRFDYVSGYFPNSPQKLTNIMLKRLGITLSQSFPDSARSIHDIQDTVEASDEWNPGEPPLIWDEKLGEQLDENIQNQFFEIAHPFLVLGIGRDSSMQISEPQKEIIGRNLRNLWNGLSKEEKKPILGLMLWSLQELNEERSQINRQLIGTPDGIAAYRQGSTRSFNQLQNVIRGLFSSFSTEEAVKSRKDMLFSLTKRLWDSKDERIVYEAKEKLMKLRGTVLEKIEGTSLTVEEYIQTDDAWLVFKQLKSDLTL